MRPPRPAVPARPARAALAAAALAGIGALSCGSKDNVTVSAAIRGPQVGAAEKGLVKLLCGGFDLYVEVGAHSPVGTDVEALGFSLARGGGGPVLVSPLLVKADRAFPVHLEPGQSSTVRMTVDYGAAGVDAKTYDDVKAAASVQIAGTIKDSAQGATTPVGSQPFAPGAGCP